MKILVYGAGVQGSVYCARLRQAGHEVSVLARGARLREIRAYGIGLRELPHGVQVATQIDVVETLEPEYDHELIAKPKTSTRPQCAPYLDVILQAYKRKRNPGTTYRLNSVAKVRKICCECLRRAGNHWRE